MAETRLPHLPRPRLTDRLRDTRVAVIEGGGGYGKTALALEFADVLDVPALYVPLMDGHAAMRSSLAEGAHHAGLPRLATALHTAGPDAAAVAGVLSEYDGPLLLILDDLHLARDPAAVACLVADVPNADRMVLLLGRSVPAAAIEAAEELTHLGLDDLTLTPDEIRGLGERLGHSLSTRQVATIVSRTGGWVTPVLGALGGPDRGDLDTSVARSAARVMDDLIGSIEPDDLGAVVDLAHLPMVNLDLAKWVGRGGAWERAIGLGLPVQSLQGGWSRIANPIQERLTTRHPADPTVVVEAAAAYRDAGEIPIGLRLLAIHATPADQADFLAGATDDQLLRWVGPDLLDVIDGLPDDVLAGQPAPLLAASFLCSVLGATDRRTAVAERLDRLVARDHPARAEVEAELASHGAWLLRDPASVRDRVNAIVADQGAPARARARAHETQGLNDWLFRDGEPEDALAEYEEAGSRLTVAVDLWRQLGEPVRAVWPLTWRAVASEWNSGQYLQALRSLDEARALAVGRPLVEVFVVPFRAMILAEIGRYDEAEQAIADARALAAVTASRSRAAYAAWAAARIASQRGDAGATLLLVREAEALGARDSGGGAFFAADAAQLLARVSDWREATTRLDFAIENDHDPNRRFVPVARIVLAARAGHFEEAWAIYSREFLDEESPRERIDPRDHPRVLLLLAHAALSSDEPERAASLAMEAFEAAARFDVPDALLVRERDIAWTMLPLAAQHGSSAARHLLGTGVRRIRVLGGFSIEQRGGPAAEPSGILARCLKFLAVRGGRAAAEAVARALWPDADAALGRRRLRTVLRRIRDEIDEDLVQRDNDAVCFGPGVTIDATEFDAASVQALREDDVGAADAAFAQYTGPLLPDDLYEPWAEDERRRLEWRWLAVLDLLVDAAESAGDVPRAQRLLQLGIDAQPDVEDRYLRSARLYLRQGRRGRARAVLGRAIETLDSLEFRPSDDVRRMLDDLTR